MHINTVVPMIAMLGHLEIDIKVSDVGMETIEFSNCREVSEDDRDTSSILVIMQEEARFFCKDRQKFINPFI